MTSELRSEERELATKLEKFSGKRKDWEKWSRRFMTAAEERGFDIIINLEEEIKIPGRNEELTGDPDEIEEMRRLIKLNARAYMALTHVIDDEDNFEIVANAVTEEQPKGDARLAWKNLTSKYKAGTVQLARSLVKEFNSMKLRSVRTPPAEYVAEVLSLQRRINRLGNKSVEISDYTALDHIVNSIKVKEYAYQVEDFKKLLRKDNLEVQEIIDALNEKYIEAKIERKERRKELREAWENSDDESNEDDDELEEEVGFLKEIREKKRKKKRQASIAMLGKDENNVPEEIEIKKQEANGVAQNAQVGMNMNQGGNQGNGYMQGYNQMGMQGMNNQGMQNMQGRNMGVMNNDQQGGFGFRGVCNICGKVGHKAADCWHKNNGHNRNMNQNNFQRGNGMMNQQMRQQMNQQRNQNGYFGQNYNGNMNMGNGMNQGMQRMNNMMGQGNYGYMMRYCTYCGRNGHTIEQCFMKQRVEEQNKMMEAAANRNNGQMNAPQNQVPALPPAQQEPANENEQVNLAEAGGPTTLGDENSLAMMASGAKNNAKLKHLWIADSGCSGHICKDLEGMYDIEEESTDIRIGDGKYMKGTKTGKIKMNVIQEDGKIIPITLQNVRYVPTACYNLFSITAAMKHGFSIGGSNQMIYIEKGSFRLMFDRIIKTDKCFLCGIHMQPRSNEAAMAGLIQGTTIKVNELHEKLGHMGEEMTRKVGKLMKVKVTGKMIKCEHCAIAKARHKNLKKVTNLRSKTAGERLYIDISQVKCKSLGGRAYWLLIVDEATDMKWTFCLKKKSDQVEALIGFISDLKNIHKKKPKYIRCDNAGENESFQQEAQKRGLGLIFEYTSPGTPQHNGVVERAFQTLYGRIRAMLRASGMTEKLKQTLWAECASTCTKLDNLTPSRNDENKCCHEAFYGNIPKYATELRTFGEIAIVTDHEKKKIINKLNDRGRECMFVGYATNHAGDVYRFLNTKTHKIVKSRDTVWMNKTYGEYFKKNIDKLMIVEEEEVEHIIERGHMEALTPIEETDDDEDDVIEHETTVKEEEESDKEESKELRIDEPEEEQTDTSDMIDETEGRGNSNYNLRPSPKIRKRMDTGVEDEDSDEGLIELSKKVQKVNEDMHEAERSGDTSKIAELVDEVRELKEHKALKQEVNMVEELSYAKEESDMQEMGELAMVNAVASDPQEPKTFRAAWNCGNEIDREKWRDAIRKEFSQMKKNKVWTKINKSIVPPNRRIIGSKWVFKKKRNGVYRGRLVGLGYSQIPGLDYTENFAPVINDVTFRMLLVLQIAQKLEGICIDVETAFLYAKLDEEIYMEIPRGYHEVEGDDGPNDCLLLHQAIYGLVQSARQWHKKFIQTLKEYKFQVSQSDPCLLYRHDDKGPVYIAVYVDDALCIGSREGIQKAVSQIKEKFKVKEDGDLKDYLGCYIMKNKDNTAASNLHLRELYRVIKYVLDTRNRSLRVEPTHYDDKVNVTVFSDSDYAGDKDNRRSTTGYVIFLMGTAIAWKSKAQDHVTLSVTEAEYCALSEAAKEAKFILNLLKFMEVKVDMPITMWIDNEGAKFLANNNNSGQRTKHIDARYHYVRELIEENLVEVKYTPTDRNTADIFTKNLHAELFDIHAMNMTIDIDSSKITTINPERDKEQQE